MLFRSQNPVEPFAKRSSRCHQTQCTQETFGRSSGHGFTVAAALLRNRVAVCELVTPSEILTWLCDMYTYNSLMELDAVRDVILELVILEWIPEFIAILGHVVVS